MIVSNIEDLQKCLNEDVTIYDLMDNIVDYESLLSDLIFADNRELLGAIIKKQLFRTNPLSGKSLIAETALYDNLELLKWMIDQGLDVNMNNGDALIECVIAGSIGMAQNLIDLGADIRIGGDYIAHWAFDNRNRKTVDFLSKNGIDFSKSGIDIDKVTDLDFIEYLPWAQEPTVSRQVVESLFGKLTPRLLKDLYSRIHEAGKDSPNTKLVNFFKLAKDIRPELNNDILLNVSFKRWNFDYRSAPVDELRKLLSYYGDKRLLNLLQSEFSEREFIIDAARTLDIIQKTLDGQNERIVSEEDVKEHLPRKPKTFKEIHDNLVILTRKIDQADYKLAQKSVMFLDGCKINDYTIVIPKTSHDLIEVGNALNICVGNGWYAERARDGSMELVLLVKGSKFIACIEINGSGQVVQAKMHSNEQFTDSQTKKFLVESIKLGHLKDDDTDKETKNDSSEDKAA